MQSKAKSLKKFKFRVKVAPKRVQKKQYIYQYKDHLGNSRLSFAKNSAGVLETLDKNDYYPFGMNHLDGNSGSFFGQSSYKNYKYNGKELQETGMYDYGARFYMPDIGRWEVVDPLAEKYRRWSPYNYAVNNPILFIDPDGRGVIIKGKDNDAKENFRQEINKGLGGYYEAKIDKKGNMSLVKTSKTGTLNSQQQAFHDTFDTAIRDPKNTKLKIVSEDKNVRIGNFSKGKIDIADAKKLGSSDLSTPQNVSSQGAIAHEMKEQFEKQVNGKTYDGGAHASATSTENSVKGNVRTEIGVFQITDLAGKTIDKGEALQSTSMIGNNSKTVTIIVKNGNVSNVDVR